MFRRGKKRKEKDKEEVLRRLEELTRQAEEERRGREEADERAEKERRGREEERRGREEERRRRMEADERAEKAEKLVHHLKSELEEVRTNALGEFKTVDGESKTIGDALRCEDSRLCLKQMEKGDGTSPSATSTQKFMRLSPERDRAETNYEEKISLKNNDTSSVMEILEWTNDEFQGFLGGNLLNKEDKEKFEKRLTKVYGKKVNDALYKVFAKGHDSKQKKCCMETQLEAEQERGVWVPLMVAMEDVGNCIVVSQPRREAEYLETKDIGPCNNPDRVICLKPGKEESRAEEKDEKGLVLLEVKCFWKYPSKKKKNNNEEANYKDKNYVEYFNDKEAYDSSFCALRQQVTYMLCRGHRFGVLTSYNRWDFLLLDIDEKQWTLRVAGPFHVDTKLINSKLEIDGKKISYWDLLFRFILLSVHSSPLPDERPEQYKVWESEKKGNNSGGPDSNVDGDTKKKIGKDATKKKPQTGREATMDSTTSTLSVFGHVSWDDIFGDEQNIVWKREGRVGDVIRRNVRDNDVVIKFLRHFDWRRREMEMDNRVSLMEIIYDELRIESVAYSMLKGLQGSAIPHLLYAGGLNMVCDEIVTSFAGETITDTTVITLDQAKAALSNLDRIHTLGVSHQDLNFRNLCLSNCGTLMFIDFGNAFINPDMVDTGIEMANKDPAIEFPKNQLQEPFHKWGWRLEWQKTISKERDDFINLLQKLLPDGLTIDNKLASKRTLPLEDRQRLMEPGKKAKIEA